MLAISGCIVTDAELMKALAERLQPPRAHAERRDRPLGGDVTGVVRHEDVDLSVLSVQGHLRQWLQSGLDTVPAAGWSIAPLHTAVAVCGIHDDDALS
jgi:hypothetical protein